MSFACPRCNRISHHPEDVRKGYCGNCHAFTGESYTGETLDTAMMLARLDHPEPEIVAQMAEAFPGIDGFAVQLLAGDAIKAVQAERAQ